MDKYLALRTVATKHYPTETNYCSVIALAVATGWTFGKARSVLYRGADRITAKGTSVSRLHAVLKQHGYRTGFATVPKAKTPISAQRALENTTGTYFLYTKDHVACVQDGVCQDWSNNAHRRNHDHIESIYKIEKV